MFSKSAQYIRTTAQQPDGVLALAEVALGEKMEYRQSSRYAAGEVEKAKCDSAYAMGTLQPDPASAVAPFGDGVQVPSGKTVERQLEGGQLRHNGE
jgi:hypothetical protein